VSVRAAGAVSVKKKKEKLGGRFWGSHDEGNQLGKEKGDKV